MAPLTRRAAKALDSSTKQEAINSTPKPKPADEPATESVALRSKRKAPTDPDKVDKDKEHGAECAKGKAAPRRNKLDVGALDSVTPSRAKKSPIQVQIPSSAVMTPRSQSSPIPDSQDTDVLDEGNMTIMSASNQLEEDACHKLELLSRSIESGLESTPLAKAPKSTIVGSPGDAQKEPATRPQTHTESQSGETEATEAEDNATPRPAAAKSTHVVFGDDDDVDKFVAAAAATTNNAPEDREQQGAEKEDEDEESNDEAPEAVSTATAARETLKSARAAIEAAEQFAASTKRKRQARNNLLKQQAETRKRTRETDNTATEGEDSSDGEQNTTSKRQRRSRNLPDVLPAEFLTDSSEDEGDEATLKKMVKRPQKITFETAMQALGTEGRGPRDEIVGSTRYRVLAKESDQRLAPKANKNSRLTKEDLLRRGRQRVETNKKRGFFVKR